MLGSFPGLLWLQFSRLAYATFNRPSPFFLQSLTVSGGDAVKMPSMSPQIAQGTTCTTAIQYLGVGTQHYTTCNT